jgi:hypothetical protein
VSRPTSKLLKIIKKNKPGRAFSVSRFSKLAIRFDFIDVTLVAQQR